MYIYIYLYIYIYVYIYVYIYIHIYIYIYIYICINHVRMNKQIKTNSYIWLMAFGGFFSPLFPKYSGMLTSRNGGGELMLWLPVCGGN